jgi:hypothetical protein
MNPAPSGDGPHLVRTLLRADGPDGSGTAFTLDADGALHCDHRSAGGRHRRRLLAAVEPTGGCRVSADRGPGTPAVPIGPDALERRTNPYGVHVERATYGPVLVVERSTDREARVFEITMRGPWGEQTVEFEPDGSRTMRWHTVLHEGRQSWDAGGRRVAYTVTGVDGSTHRWVAPHLGDRSGGAAGAASDPGVAG